MKNVMDRIPQRTENATAEGITYLLKAGNHYKIGITTITIKKRIAQLQTGNPLKIEVVLMGAYSLDDISYYEGVLHGVFKNKKMRGEWFKLSKKDIKQIERLFNRTAIATYVAIDVPPPVYVFKEVIDAKVTPANFDFHNIRLNRGQ